LFDLVNSLFEDLDAKFLMENSMVTASLEDERLRTKLKESQDALEALAKKGQAKDLPRIHQ
jgi:hypothetical protein